MPDATFGHNKLADIAFMGMRSALGVIFILNGINKTNPGFVNALENMGLPPELQFPIVLAELIPGILLIIGILSRISASLLSIIMLGAIFYVKGAASITGQGGTQIDLIILASCLVLIVMGPGRVSLAHIVKKIPRPIH